MTDQPTENKHYPWNDTLRLLLLAFLPAIAVLLWFHSTAGAFFVFIIMSFCRTWEDFRILLFCGLIAVTLRSCAFEPFNIPSASMKSTLLIGDYLFVSKYSYGYSRYSFPFGLPLFDGRIMEYDKPKRGDVVVFRPPGSPRVDFIKRLIGLPGDRIQVKSGILYINDVPVPRHRIDDYADDENKSNIHSVPRFDETLPGGKTFTILKQIPVGPSVTDNTPVFEVPPGHYFMMGDNRDNSQDSRFMNGVVGFVPEDNLVGRAEIIWFSTDGSAEWTDPVSWFKAMRLSRFFTRVE